MRPRTAPMATSVLRTRDAARAHETLCNRYKPHDMRRIPDAGAFDFVHMSAAVPDGSLNILTYGSGVEITPEPFADFFMLEMPVRAGVDLDCIDGAHVASGAGTALFLSPEMRFRSIWRTGCVQIMLKLQADAILRRWQFAVNDATATLPLFGPEINLSTPEGWRVRQMLLLMRREFERAVTHSTDCLAVSPLAAATIDAVIGYYRIYGAEPATRRPREHPDPLCRCIRHVAENLSGDLSVAALLRVTGTSERTLFNQFRKHLGTTPQAYVRAERLRAARERLLRGRGSVADIAHGVGIAHLGRFAAAYRQMFNESPSATKRH